MDAEMSSIGTTQALEEGLSVATSKFNTARFGTLSVHPNSASGTNFGAGTVSGTDQGYRDMDVSDFQDDDFDGELEGVDFSEIDNACGIEEIAMETDIGHPDSTASRTTDSEARTRRMTTDDEAQGFSESEALREKLAKMEELLKAKEAELTSKTGEVSVLRMNLNSRNKDLMKVEGDLRTAQERHRVELLAAKQKLHAELENKEVAHHFAVSKIIMDGPRSSKTQTQPAARQLPPAPSFPSASMSSSPSIPSTPFPFNSSQTSMKAKQRSDDSFSLDVFKPSQNSMSKIRPIGPRAASFDKPKQVTVQPAESVRTARPIFGFNSEIPSQSPEEIEDDDYGLSQLRFIDPDEEGHAPLKGSKRYDENLQLGAITQQCYKSVLGLVQRVSSRSKGQALRDTTRLLQLSLVLDKPLHAMNALKVLRTLMFTYEDLSDEVSRGLVPFMEHDNEDAWVVQASETSLPSTLACVEYLLLTRLARDPPIREAVGGVAYKLKDETEKLFQLEIIQVMNYVAWSQTESSHLARTFVPLIRKGIFEEMIRYQTAKNNLRHLRPMLEILDIVSREVECCKLLMGWRVSQQAWSNVFKFMNTLIGLLGTKSESLEKLANGVLPRIKMTILTIFGRCLYINLEQTKRILSDTKLVSTLVYCIRDLEELAATIHHQKTLVLVHRSRRPEGGFITNIHEQRTHPLLEKPLFMTSMGLGGQSKDLKATGTEIGVSPLACVPLNPYDKVFDYLAVLKLSLEMVLNLLRTLPDDMRRLFGRRPNERHALAFVVSKIEVRDLGLAEEARNLAHDILFELVPDDDTEQEYIDLVRDDD
ncbi:hypothetical protein EC991_002953 [Linnemannia zychae]|nr:hypothetical protein EC991_002953 [Linnemannia zychae]